MDDYKIADSKSIEMMNNEYKKLLNKSNENNISALKQNKFTYLIKLLDSLNKEKQLITHFNNKSENNLALNESINILKDIFCLVDEIISSYNIDYNFTIAKKSFSFKNLYNLNLQIIVNMNSILKNNIDSLLASKIKSIKEKQIDLFLILLPFTLTSL